MLLRRRYRVLPTLIGRTLKSGMLGEHTGVRPMGGTTVIRGSCLCEGVRFEVGRAIGPFELCHCNRCRKVSGSAFMSGVAVRRDEFNLLSGRELVRRFEAPLLKAPPAYSVCFCGTCGSPLPDVHGESEWLEIPAGLLDDDPKLKPDKHIFVDVKAPWFAISDELPKFDEEAIIRHRLGK